MALRGSEVGVLFLDIFGRVEDGRLGLFVLLGVALRQEPATNHDSCGSSGQGDDELRGEVLLRGGDELDDGLFDVGRLGLGHLFFPFLRWVLIIGLVFSAISRSHE